MSSDVVKNEANEKSQVPMTSTDGEGNDKETGVERDPFYNLTVVPPAAPDSRDVKIIASAQESISDIRQNLVSHPLTQHLTNYHFEYNSKALNEYIELSLIPDLPLEGASLIIVQDNYSDRTIRAHFLRIKELISPKGTTSKGIGEDWGINPGATIAEQVLANPSPAPASLQSYFSQPLPDLSSILAPPARSASPAPNQTIKSLQLAHWNPAPAHRRTQGDLIYLTFTSLEGDLYHITGHIRGFYVSRSTNQKFDPTPKNPQKLPTHSLLTLLQTLSPQFTQAFNALHPTDGTVEILSDAPLANSLPAFPWLVQAPQTTPDPTRLQKPWLESLADGQSNLRDWNDEIQSTRSLPASSVRERLIRERLLQKSLTDFSACATYAAMLVRRGELLPLDPVPEQDLQIQQQSEHVGSMWHYNNIFLSLGAEDLLGSFQTEGGAEAARVAVGKDVIGVSRVNALLLDTDTQVAEVEDGEKPLDPTSGLCTLGTIVVDYLGERIVAQSVVPGIFQQVAETPPDENGAVAGAHKIVYGSVENGEKIYMDSEFDGKFKKIMDKLHVKQHDVWEIPKKEKEGKESMTTNGVNGDHADERKKRTIRTSLETKGLRGADGRNYVLDLYKLTPLDIVFIEEHYQHEKEPYPHRLAFLRGECVDAFWLSKGREWLTAKRKETQESPEDGAAEEDSEKVDEEDKIDASEFEFALNPDVFTTSQAPISEAEKNQVHEDEGDVRACCGFLRDVLIPELMTELTDGSGGWPVDGKSLTTIMHRHGVNVRYLGKVIELCGETIKLKAVKGVAMHEMVSRATKHVLSRYLRKLPLLHVSTCVSHLLNCLVGFKFNALPQPHFSPDDEFDDFSQAKWTEVTVRGLQEEITREVFKRFRYRLNHEWWSQSSCIVLLREVCLKLGFQLKARTYLFDRNENCPAKPKKATNGTNGHHVEETTFYPEDIMNVVPVIKDAPMKSVLAEEAYDAGKAALLQNRKELGIDLLAESLSLHEQIYGVLHPDVARGYSKLSLIYNQLDEMRATACELARKAVIVSERTLGLDNQETILNWLNWALCEHSNGNTKVALSFIIHVLSIWRNIFGEGHPDEVTMMNNVAVMLQSIREHQASLTWFERSLSLCTELHGKDSLGAGTIAYQYAQALALAQDPISAVPKMRDAYTVFAREFGPEDSRTQETEFLLQHFTTIAVNTAKQAKLGNNKIATPNVKVDSSVKPVGAQEIDGIGSRGLQNIDELVKYIGGVGASGVGQKTSPKKKRGGKR